jgi:ankyrin repeat protein
MYAAACDHHEIVGRLIVARADLNTKAKDTDGCAHSPRPVRRPCWSPTLPIAPAPAPSGRRTALHFAALHGSTKSAVELLVGGADHTIMNNDW